MIYNESKPGHKVWKTLVAASALGLIGLQVASCSSSTTNVGSLVLPTSNKTIDVVQHRSDSKECAVGWVLQTYDARGGLIDSKSGGGNALHCQIFQAGIQAGGMVGAAAVLRPSRTNVDNSNDSSNVSGSAASAVAQQNQHQRQGQGQNQWNSGPSNPPSEVGNGHGNNGIGNGNGDGTNPGTGHHHDNGDNN